MTHVCPSHQISSGQLFALLFGARISCLLSMGAFFPGQLSLQQWILPLILSGLCLFLLILPFWLLQKKYHGQPFPQILRAKWGKAAAIPLLLYALWFLLEAAVPLVLLSLFLSRAVEPLVPVPLVSLALSAAGLYASRKGTEAMGRTAAVLSFFLALGALLLTVMLLTKQNLSNWEPVWQGEGQNTATGILFLLARGSGLGPFLFLSGQTRAHAWRSFCLWDIASTALACILSGAAAGAMGNYLNNQIFPLYTAASYAETGPARGLGAIVIAMWLFSTLIGLSMDLRCFALCVGSVSPKAESKLTLLGALAVAIFSLAAFSVSFWQSEIYHFGVLLPYSLLCIFLFPLLLLFKKQKTSSRKKLVLLSVTCLILLSLCSCTDQTRLDRRILINGIGIDFDGKQYLVTVQALNASEQETSGVTIYTTEGKSVLEALQALTKQTGKDPLYHHASLIAFGPSCAEQGVGETLDFLIRSIGVEPDISLLLSKGEAAELLSAERDGETVTAQTMSEILETRNINGQIVNTNLVEFVNGISHPAGGAVLPVFTSGEDGVKAVGSALFSEDGTILDTLTEEETRGLLLLSGQFDRGMETVSLSDGTVLTAELSGVSLSAEPSFQQGSPALTLRIACEAAVVSLGQEAEAGGARDKERKALEEQIKKEAQAVMDLCLKEQQTDIFSFYSLFQREAPTFWEEHGEHWKEELPDLQTEIRVLIDLKESGRKISFRAPVLSVR